MTATSERRLPPCEDCGGIQVGNLKVTSQQYVGLHPAGRTLWSRPMFGLYAAVCLNCARVKLFAGNVEKLRESSREHPDWFTW